MATRTTMTTMIVLTTMTTKTTKTTKTAKTTMTTVDSYYNNYNDHRNSDLYWERSSEYSDLLTQLTIIDKLRNLNHDIEMRSRDWHSERRVTWTAFASLAMFLYTVSVKGILMISLKCYCHCYTWGGGRGGMANLEQTKTSLVIFFI